MAFTNDLEKRIMKGSKLTGSYLKRKYQPGRLAIFGSQRIKDGCQEMIDLRLSWKRLDKDGYRLNQGKGPEMIINSYSYVLILNSQEGK